MDELKLQFLGDIRILRGGEEFSLPPSRKTRGLLAYLALNPRSFRRDQLCELLWEIPDDPRGSLRWSLSKLRRLVDDEANTRIVADRSQVAFDACAAQIDVTQLQALVEGDLDAVPVEDLQAAAENFQGQFLEGLDLHNFHEFYTWCIGQREQVNRAQVKLLKALHGRLADEPENALPFARQLAALAPLDESVHHGLIRILAATGRTQEAEQQKKTAQHLLAEAGIEFVPQKIAPAPAAPLPESASPATADVLPLPASAGQAIKYTREQILGRDTETAELVAGFNEACSTSRARFFLLRGEPGIGKSRLLQLGREMVEFVDVCVLQADAIESEIVRPFALWSDAIRRHPTLELPSLFSTDAPVARDLMFASLSDIVAAESAKRPVFISFDDMQWCDESSAAALHYVVRMNRDRPLFVETSAREAELRDNVAMNQALRGLRHEGLLQEVHLGPLDRGAICELIESAAPGIDATRLAEESHGNPLLAIELARAQASGDQRGSLVELVRERLSRLDDDAREIVLWSSVVAPNIERKSLERLVDMPRGRLDAALEMAQAQGMLIPGDHGFRFSHDLIGSSVYEEIPPSVVQGMHLRVAEQLEVETALNLQLAADLAHHAAKSGDRALAARAMVSAGRLCLRFYANEDALNLALTGLEHAATLPDADRVCLTLELSDVRVAAAPIPDWKAAADEYVDLAEQALDHGALPFARLGYHLASTLRWMHGDWDSARNNSLQAERVTRASTDEEHIIGMAETAKCLALLEKDLPQADAMLMEAQALASRKSMVTPTIAQASGILRYYEGDLDRAEELLQEARTQFKANGERINEYAANEYLLMIALERGDFHGADFHCQSLLRLGEKVREGSELPYARAMHCLLQRAAGKESGELEANLQALREVDAKFRLSYLLNRLALLSYELEDFAGSVAQAEEALACAEVLARASEMMFARTTLALSLRKLGDTEGVQNQLDKLHQMEGLGVASWARERTDGVVAAINSA